MRILVVEDDPASSLILTALLRVFGETDAEVNGQAGLEAFKRALMESRPYDLVCLDIMMPIMDGQAVLKSLRSFEDEQKVPSAKAAKVIMTTALGDKENFVEALPRCDAYLQKPIDRTQLLFYIKKFGLLSPSEAAALTERERKRKEAEGRPAPTKDMPWVD
jgi:two-component system chemotaxis response regulator CheY